MDVKVDCYLLKLNVKHRKESANFSIIDLNQFLTDFITSFDYKFQGVNDGTTKIFPSEVKINSKKEIIFGFVKGGKTNYARDVYAKENPDELVIGLSVDHITSIDHFMIIHLPKATNVGIILVQGFSTESISDTFCRMFINYFNDNHPSEHMEFERYIPKRLQAFYESNAEIKKIILRKRKLSTDEAERTLGTKFKDEDFSIEIVVRSTGTKFFSNLMKSDGILSIPIIDELGLDGGLNVSIAYEYNGKQATAKLSNDFKIQPTFYISNDDLEFNKERNLPKKSSIQSVCLGIFEEIKSEIYGNTRKD